MHPATTLDDESFASTGQPPAPAGRPGGLARRVRKLRDDQRGEGVISAAIAVLIMAFVGVGAFVAYKAIMGDVTERTQDCVSAYVTDAAECGNS